jgi:hypothetical protein
MEIKLRARRAAPLKTLEKRQDLFVIHMTAIRGGSLLYSGRRVHLMDCKVSQARYFHHHRPPRSAKSQALSTNTLSLLERRRMVFEQFLLPVSLAEDEAGKALGGLAGWRTENERECHTRPSAMANLGNVRKIGLAG